MSLLARSSLRTLGRHPAQVALAALGVALGVAVVVSIDLANRSAERAFALATASVVGRATHRVTGGPGGLPDALYRRLVVDLDVAEAAPVVEGWATVDGPGGRRALRLLGVDPFAEAPFRPWTGGGGAAGDELAAFLTRRGAALLPAPTARELGVAPGDELPVEVDGRATRLRVAGLLDPADELSRRALTDLAVVDVATAQELLRRPGRLSRIDLAVPPGPAGAAMLRRLRGALPPGARLVAAGARSRSSAEMTRAFRLNLTALSLLALVCGLFLIYNSMTFSVVQRRGLLGTLRCLGVTRRQVFRLVLGEAAAVAVVGTAAGLALGVLLGRGMVRLVTRTLNDLYFVVSVRDLAVSPASLALGAALGLGATLAAAALPAWEASTTPPHAARLRSGLEGRVRRTLPRRAAAAALLLAAGAAALALPVRALVPAFAGLFALIVGCALLAPAATLGLMRLATGPARRAFGVLGALAARGVAASLSRTGVAIAALAVAVSVTVGVGVMVSSFRGTVERWLRGALSADAYVSAPAAGGATVFAAAPFEPALGRAFAAVPGVTAVSSVRRAEIVDLAGRTTRVVVVPPDRAALRRLEVLAGDPGRVPAALASGAVLVSEPLAWRRHLAPGDRLRLPTDRGAHAFPVAGVYASYASDQGIVLMTRPTWERFWDDRRVSGFALTLAPGVDAAAVAPGLRRAAGPGAVLVIESSRELRQASLAVFDRTFLITGVLRLLAGLVAGIGVVSALMALELERGRELAVLRANGMTPGQLWRLVTAQTGLMGLAAGLLSLPVGLLLAAVMIFVINRRSFGWTLHMNVPPHLLVEAVALALGAALLAGLYPAWRMARTPPADALRTE